MGRRLTRVTILAGSIVRVWGSLEAVLERYQGMLSRSDRTMRVVRADFGAHGSLIGASHTFESVKLAALYLLVVMSPVHVSRSAELH